MAAKKERVYTEAEKKRLERLTKVTEEMAARGYTRNDRIIDLGKANLILGIVSIPVFLIGVMLFFFASDSPDFDMGLRNSLILLVSIVVLTVVHELIHGATWSIFSENHWKDIDFGFIVRTMNPYCTCCQPLEKDLAYHAAGNSLDHRGAADHESGPHPRFRIRSPIHPEQQAGGRRQQDYLHFCI